MSKFGTTSSCIAFATEIAIQHNMKVLLVSTAFNDSLINESFWQDKKKMWGTFHAAKPRFSQQLLYFTKSKYPVPYLPRNINNF